MSVATDETVQKKNGTKAAATKAAKQQSAEIAIDKIDIETLVVPIVGLTPLIVHRFSEKAKKQMLDAATGKKSPREPKDPEAEYEAAFYRMADGHPGMLAGAFKDATVGGARWYAKVRMTELRSFLRFLGEIGQDGRMMVPVEGVPIMREDVVRVNRGGTDLRYRPEFREWRTKLVVQYPPSLLTQASVLSLIGVGGHGIGVGEWRPEKGGEFGTYQVDPDTPVKVSSGSFAVDTVDK